MRLVRSLAPSLLPAYSSATVLAACALCALLCVFSVSESYPSPPQLFSSLSAALVPILLFLSHFKPQTLFWPVFATRTPFPTATTHL